MRNAIDLRDVARRQGRFRLGPVTLAIPAGGIFGLIGPNGAGKTTLLDLICGIGRADAGTITVLRMDIARNEVAIKQRIAYAGPETSYLPWGRIGRLLDFVSGFYPDWDDAKCTELLEAFGLQRSQSISGLSFGGASKVAEIYVLGRLPACRPRPVSLRGRRFKSLLVLFFRKEQACHRSPAIVARMG